MDAAFEARRTRLASSASARCNASSTELPPAAASGAAADAADGAAALAFVVALLDFRVACRLLST